VRFCVCNSQREAIWQQIHCGPLSLIYWIVAFVRPTGCTQVVGHRPQIAQGGIYSGTNSRAGICEAKLSGRRMAAEVAPSRELFFDDRYPAFSVLLLWAYFVENLPMFGLTTSA
jgi:hypothetical protein